MVLFKSLEASIVQVKFKYTHKTIKVLSSIMQIATADETDYTKNAWLQKTWLYEWENNIDFN